MTDPMTEEEFITEFKKWTKEKNIIVRGFAFNTSSTGFLSEKLMPINETTISFDTITRWKE